ncbi:MAG: hypothetical protein ACOCVN_03100 [bacterium]
MSVKTRNVIIGFGTWAIIVATIFYVDLRKKAKIEAQLDIEYPRIELQDSLNNIVKKTYQHEIFTINPYLIRIQFKNNRKSALGVKFITNQPALQEVIKPRTHIYKEAGSDTIWVQDISQSDTLKMFFLLRKKGE